MPPIPPLTHPDPPRPEAPEPGTPASVVVRSEGDAPVSFVPHSPSGAVSGEPIKIQAGRFGALETHELVRLLSSIEDERARGRFRESVYLSIFFWLIVVAVVLYGPRYLWHAPQLILPSDVLKQRELTQLNAPVLRHVPAPSAKPSPKPALDNHTLEKLREMSRRTPAPVPTPTPTNTPPPTAPVPTMAPPNAPTPVATHAPPIVADAPLPQPRATKPNFNAGSTSPSNAVQQAIQDTARNQGSGGSISAPSHGGGGGSPLNTGVDILSDTQGVNFDPYIRKILREIYDHWLPLIPEEARPPLSKSGVTLVRFTILPDGTIGGMHLDDSTHDDALNRAAWGSIVSTGQFPALPSQFHGPNLELRIHYLVNKPQ